MAASHDIRVKICGLKMPAEIKWASDAGAAYVGLVFFPPSPRAVTPEEAAMALVGAPEVTKVALMVDPDDALVDQVAALPIDILQLHGRETPERVSTLRTRTGLRVMKAIGVRDAEDLTAVDRYAGAADQILIDAKPPKDSPLPGGNGLSFDWQLVAGRQFPLPWMLAGGLTPDNVAEAIRLTGAAQVDVSSGVESAPGQKSKALIDAFMAAARRA